MGWPSQRILDAMTWEAALDGHMFDLEDLPYFFDNDPRVRSDGDRYWLASSSFADLHDANEVQQEAGHVVERINGAMRLQADGFQGVRLGGRYRNENGEHVILAVGSAVLREKAGRVTLVGGTPAPRPVGPREYVHLSATDVAVADVLLILGKGDLDWYDLWKVFEIIRMDVGGKRTMIVNGWASQSDLDAFGASANHPGVSGEAARHARRTERVPNQTITIGQGRDFIADLARSWMKSRLN